MWAIRTALDLGSHHPKAGIESYSATVIDMICSDGNLVDPFQEMMDSIKHLSLSVGEIKF